MCVCVCGRDGKRNIAMSLFFSNDEEQGFPSLSPLLKVWGKRHSGLDFREFSYFNFPEFPPPAADV